MVLADGVGQDGSQWQAGPENFLLPEKAASTVDRTKFCDAMREAELLEATTSTARLVKQVLGRVRSCCTLFAKTGEKASVLAEIRAA